MDKKRIGAVAVVCLLVCGAAQGGLVLDQFQEACNSQNGFSYLYVQAQTFTPDVSGVLGLVELGNTYPGAPYPMDPTPPVVKIYNTTLDGQPGSTLLGSGVASEPIPADGWIGIDLLSEGIHLTAGERYAIVLYPLEDKLDKWVTVGFHNNSDSYGPGSRWSRAFDSDVWEASDGDIQFRTYMDAPVIPVPGAAMLGMIGMATAGWLKRRRAL